MKHDNRLFIWSPYGSESIRVGNAGVAFFVAGISLSYHLNHTPLSFVRSEAFVCIAAELIAGSVPNGSCPAREGRRAWIRRYSGASVWASVKEPSNRFRYLTLTLKWFARRSRWQPAIPALCKTRQPGGLLSDRRFRVLRAELRVVCGWLGLKEARGPTGRKVRPGAPRIPCRGNRRTLRGSWEPRRG